MAFVSVASAAADTSLLAGGLSNGDVLITNTDANRLHVLLDSGVASTTNCSFSLAQNEEALVPNYSGPVRGCWAADGSGAACITYWQGN